MTLDKSIQKSDDFKLAIIFKVEGHGSRAIMLRFLGIIAALM